MNTCARHLVLILFVWLMMAGLCLGKQVYLKDGGIIEGQSAWRHGDKVFVKVNRDIVADFDLNEIDVRRTFPGTATSPHRLHSKPVVSTATAATEPSPVPPPDTVPSPLAAPPPKPAPITTSSAVEPSAAPSPAIVESAAPPDKAELQRRAQEATKMMTEALMNKDPELMRKALEMQKSAMPQQDGVARKKPGNPLVVLLLVLVVCLLIIASQWVVFEQAGEPGWKCLIPFYNMYVLMEISGKPGWWMFLLIIPLIGIVVLLLAMLSLSRKFRRSELFGVGLFFLPMIFFPVLAFGGSEYER